MPYPARFYAALHRGTPGDVEHYLRVCEGAHSVLELGCGHGRVVTALAAAGSHVTGLELDPGRLALAQQAVDALPSEASARVRLVQGDMRDALLGQRFDRVLIPFGGLYCMLHDDDLRAALHNAVAHLQPQGLLAFDVYAADEFHTESEPDDLPDDAHVPLARIEVEGTPYEVLERSVWDKAAQRIHVSYLHVGEDGECVEGIIEQRYLLEAQLREHLAAAGLELKSHASSFDGADDEPLHVVVARLAATPATPR